MNDQPRPTTADDEAPLVIPAIDGDIKTILVPVDGSSGSEKGLAYASALASLAGASLVVVVAYDPPVTVRRRGILEAESAKSEMEADALELADEAVALLRSRGHNARALVVRDDPVSAILEAAEQENADLIVMGRRGLSRLAGLLLGSVSERVARHSEIPVLLAS
jgi:nucleotide-binding universal stress UspA family protein